MHEDSPVVTTDLGDVLVEVGNVKTRSRKRFFVVLGGIVVAVIALVCVLVFSGNSPGWEKPDSDTISATRTYLSGEGAIIVEVFTLADVLESEGTTPQGCASVLTTLTSTVDAQVYRVATLGIPDPVLQSLSQSLAITLSDALISCLGESYTDMVEIPIAVVNPAGLETQLKTLSRLNAFIDKRMGELQ